MHFDSLQRNDGQLHGALQSLLAKCDSKPAAGQRGGNTKIRRFVLCLVDQIGTNFLMSHTHTHMYITIATMFLPHLGGKYGLKFSAKPND